VTEPFSVAARNDLALSLAMTGKLDEARTIIEPMARSPAAKPQTRQNLALIYGLLGDDARATAMSRMDLDDAATAANLSFFERVRSAKN
jgi:Flp pilus assembly protein TadD